mmetsp:Transcript_41861/g.80019  ORF Transcript_41861/g.80019 Transcript_41861/m.80019 type:complete len:208 (-) Transcript_41861:1036-1659(-)
MSAAAKAIAIATAATKTTPTTTLKGPNWTVRGILPSRASFLAAAPTQRLSLDLSLVELPLRLCPAPPGPVNRLASTRRREWDPARRLRVRGGRWRTLGTTAPTSTRRTTSSGVAFAAARRRPSPAQLARIAAPLKAPAGGTTPGWNQSSKRTWPESTDSKSGECWKTATACFERCLIRFTGTPSCTPALARCASTTWRRSATTFRSL